jgi:hypothetical protein
MIKANSITPLRWAIPSPYLWHCACDTLEWFRATGLEAAARAFAKIIDEVSRLELTIS